MNLIDRLYVRVRPRFNVVCLRRELADDLRSGGFPSGNGEGALNSVIRSQEHHASTLCNWRNPGGKGRFAHIDFCRHKIHSLGEVQMRTRILMVGTTMLVGLLGISACAGETMLPDTQLRAPGSSLKDVGGFGLGSGGFTAPASGNPSDPVQ